MQVGEQNCEPPRCSTGNTAVHPTRDKGVRLGAGHHRERGPALRGHWQCPPSLPVRRCAWHHAVVSATFPEALTRA